MEFYRAQNIISMERIEKILSNDFPHHENRYAPCPHYESVFTTIIAGLKSGTQECFSRILPCERESLLPDTTPL